MPHHGGDHGAVLVDAVDGVARAVAAVVGERELVPARQQVEAQILVDALHDPHVEVGIEDAQRQPRHVRAEGEVHVGPLQFVALLGGELLDDAIRPLRIAHQRREARRQRIGLQQTLVQQVGKHDAQRQVQEALEEVDGVEVDEPSARPHPPFQALFAHAQLHQPAEDASAHAGEHVGAGDVDVHQEHAGENRADGGQQDGDDAEALQCAAGVVHQEGADDHARHWDVEQVEGPFERPLGPAGERAAGRHQQHQPRRVGAVAVAAGEFGDPGLDALARIPPVAKEPRPDVRPGAQQQLQHVAEAACVVRQPGEPL